MAPPLMDPGRPVPRLDVQQVSKRFGATQALQEVCLQVAPGEVHAVIGENGAGKSTLMKILSGAFRADAGTVCIDGKAYESHSPMAGRRAGVAMIYQELNLAPHLTVEANINLGSTPSRGGWIQRRLATQRARDALTALYQADLPLNLPIHQLTIAQRQVVEIARALANQSRLLIMDEPTSSLTRQDQQQLHRLIRQLAQQGVSIIYISHFLEQCQEVCDRYTILRDGRSVATGEMKSASLPQLIREMVGRSVDTLYPRRVRHQGKPLLEVKAIAGRHKPEEASFTLHEGEILGIAGMMGSGRTELLRSLFGLDTRKQGDVVRLDRSQRVPEDPSASWKAGMGYLSEDRKVEGLMLQRSVADNLTLSDLRSVSRGGFVSQARQQEATQKWMTALRIKARGPDQTIGDLSGGNQQKIALARLLHCGSDLLFLDEPTRGVDVGSKAEIYQWMRDLACEGKAMVFVSSYLPELLGMCDRIAVLRRGRLQEARPVDSWTEESLLAETLLETE